MMQRCCLVDDKSGDLCNVIFDLVVSCRISVFRRVIDESQPLTLESQNDRIRRAVSMLADDDFSLTYKASVSYVDDEYMDEYFGVDGSDAAASGLPFYEADGGIKDYGLGIAANYKFNKTWGIVANVNYYRLTGDAEDSPIVDDEGDKNQFKSAVAVTYSF